MGVGVGVGVALWVVAWRRGGSVAARGSSPATSPVAGVSAWWVRWLTVGVVVVLGVLGWPGWWAASDRRSSLVFGEGLAALEVVALLAWRRHPVGCFWVAEAALVGYGVLGFPATPAGYAGLCATAAAAWGARRRVARYSCLGGAVLGTLAIGLARPHQAGGAQILSNLLLVLVAWFAGRAVRTRREAIDSEAALEHERVLRETTEARLALAATLHDRVGHSLVGVLRQLEAVQSLGGGDTATTETLVGRAVQRLRGALGEVSDLVMSETLSPRAATLRSAREASAPTGSLGEVLGHWVGLLASTGVSVHLSVRGDAGALPEDLHAATASLLAEGFANTAAHSEAEELSVSVDLGPSGATVVVQDPGPAKIGTSGSGTGLARQRATLTALGGHLHAAVTPDGGFRLEGHLPATPLPANNP